MPNKDRSRLITEKKKRKNRFQVSKEPEEKEDAHETAVTERAAQLYCARSSPALPPSQSARAYGARWSDWLLTNGVAGGKVEPEELTERCVATFSKPNPGQR